jgi:hypothetical protein
MECQLAAIAWPSQVSAVLVSALQQQQQQHASLASVLPNPQEHQPQPQAPISAAPALHLPGRSAAASWSGGTSPHPPAAADTSGAQQLLAGQLQSPFILGLHINHKSQHAVPPASQRLLLHSLGQGVSPAAMSVSGVADAVNCRCQPSTGCHCLLLQTVPGMPWQAFQTPNFKQPIPAWYWERYVPQVLEHCTLMQQRTRPHAAVSPHLCIDDGRLEDCSHAERAHALHVHPALL